tara:strand:+ start:1791 stop:2060 length:270 start_codon:yes stop_codon:yes gene_type:complete
MKKAIRFTTGLSLQILLLGVTGFFGTFLSDYLESINGFGDFVNSREQMELGARHIWYIWILLILVLIQIVRIVMWSVAFWDEEAKKILS